MRKVTGVPGLACGQDVLRDQRAKRLDPTNPCAGNPDSGVGVRVAVPTLLRWFDRNEHSERQLPQEGGTDAPGFGSDLHDYLVRLVGRLSHWTDLDAHARQRLLTHHGMPDDEMRRTARGDPGEFFADLALNVQLPLSPNSRGCLLFEQPDVVESREPARHVSGFLFTSNAFVEVFMILVTAFRQAGNDKPPHPRLFGPATPRRATETA